MTRSSVVVFVNGISQMDWVKVTQFELIYLLAADLARATGVHDDYVDYWFQFYNYDLDGGSRRLANTG